MCCIIFICVLFILALLLAYICSPKPALPVHFIKNENLGKRPADWKGTPVDAKKRFMNVSFPFYQDYIQIIIWIFSSHIFSIIRNAGKTFPVKQHLDDSFLQKNNTLIWLGHASFFISINGVNMLIDPHFHNTSVYKRRTANPIPPEYFTNIDCLLLSHDHADHADIKSLQQIFKQNPSITVITGLGMEKFLKPFTPETVNIHTMGWYDTYRFRGFDLSFIPSRHYAKRWNNKFNENLWGGFIIQSLQPGSRTIYFAGDSGYDEVLFKDVQQLFSPSVAVLGIGAFKPHYFMCPNHMGSKEALQAFKDTSASVMIPMHYSTFCLGSEMAEEPLDLLKKLKTDENICITIPGETTELNEWLYFSDE
jgi:L-ascorbate metabolism protein UlaG (beta-lactamase superfamily)